MKDIYFNELSVQPVTEPENLSKMVETYAETIKAAISQGFKKVRYEKGICEIMLSDDYSLYQYVSENTHQQAVKVLLATQARPYIPIGDTEAEKAYIHNEYRVSLNGEELSSEGFTSAAIYESMAIGFPNSRWENRIYNISRYYELGGIIKLQVPYSHNSDFTGMEYFQKWSEFHLPPVIQKSMLMPGNKDIHLSKHHGYDTLMSFAKRICNEDYIEEVINSIDRNSFAKQFVKCIEGTNILEITLLNKDYYGIAVRTTARNDRELKYIARLIQEKYYRQ